MSEPIRYSEVSNDWNGEAAGLAPSANGEWVKWEDYAALLAASKWQPIETAPLHGGRIYIRSVMFYSKDSQGWAYFQDPTTTAMWMHIPSNLIS